MAFWVFSALVCITTLQRPDAIIEVVQFCTSWRHRLKRIPYKSRGRIAVDVISHTSSSEYNHDTKEKSSFLFNTSIVSHSQGHGKCLEDPPEPLEEYQYPDLPAGAMYNADLQCRLQFNSTDDSIKVCSHLDELCSQLWCSINDSCTTLLRPAAPGTHCAHHKVSVFIHRANSWEFCIQWIFLIHFTVVSRSKMRHRRRYSNSHRWRLGKLVRLGRMQSQVRCWRFHTDTRMRSSDACTWWQILHWWACAL